MASITVKSRKGGKKYYIVYRVLGPDGKPKQFWVPCADRREAHYLLEDVAEAEQKGREYAKPQVYALQPTAAAPLRQMTVRELLEKYIRTGSQEWQPGTLHTIRSVVNNYILPYIGDIPVSAVTPRYIQDYYDDLLTHPAKAQRGHKALPPNISPRTVREVHKILRPAFDRAVVWGELDVNPTLSVKLPKQPHYVREQWDEEDLTKALSLCEDELLQLCIALQFSSTSRSGELAALTWDCVDVTDDAICAGRACVIYNKTLRRLYRADIKATGERGIIRVFPSVMGARDTVMVLKTPKTESSVRTVYIPAYVARLLQAHQVVQAQQKEVLGPDYHDYGLVIAQPNGAPYDVKDIAKHFKQFVQKAGLPEVDFYSLRHSGSTAKLRASGNIKAVQGDMGHASAEMLTRVYATIVDEDRKQNALLLEAGVFSKVDTKEKMD